MGSGEIKPPCEIKPFLATFFQERPEMSKFLKKSVYDYRKIAAKLAPPRPPPIMYVNNRLLNGNNITSYLKSRLTLGFHPDLVPASYFWNTRDSKMRV